MPTQEFEHVLFSIDNWDNIRISKTFERHLDNKIALGECHWVKKGIGKWMDALEVCYLMRTEDFNKLVLGSDYVANQHCYAVIPGDNRQPVFLLNFDGSSEQVMCNPISVYSSPPEGLGWTYMDGLYFQF